MAADPRLPHPETALACRGGIRADRPSPGARPQRCAEGSGESHIVRSDHDASPYPALAGHYPGPPGPAGCGRDKPAGGDRLAVGTCPASVGGWRRVLLAGQVPVHAGRAVARSRSPAGGAGTARIQRRAAGATAAGGCQARVYPRQLAPRVPRVGRCADRYRCVPGRHRRGPPSCRPSPILTPGPSAPASGQARRSAAAPGSAKELRRCGRKCVPPGLRRLTLWLPPLPVPDESRCLFLQQRRFCR